jgi:hypothetical protein
LKAMTALVSVLGEEPSAGLTRTEVQSLGAQASPMAATNPAQRSAMQNLIRQRQMIAPPAA